MNLELYFYFHLNNKCYWTIIIFINIEITERQFKHLKKFKIEMKKK